MAITLNLSDGLTASLSAEADELGLSLSDYAIQLLSANHRPWPSIRTGADAVAFWRRHDVIGTRTDLADSQAEAQHLRHAAETRALADS